MNTSVEKKKKKKKKEKKRKKKSENKQLSNPEFKSILSKMKILCPSYAACAHFN